MQQNGELNGHYHALVDNGFHCPNPVCSVAVFARWIQNRADLEFERKAKAWEVFTGLLGAITTIVGGALLFGQYIVQQTHDARARKLETYKDIASKMEAQLSSKKKTYDELKTICFALADPKNPKNNEQSRHQFEQMYWSTLIGVEGREVESAMVEFRRALERDGTAAEQSSDMQRGMLVLSKACASEVKQLEIQLSELRYKISSLVDGG